MQLASRRAVLCLAAAAAGRCPAPALPTARPPPLIEKVASQVIALIKSKTGRPSARPASAPSCVAYFDLPLHGPVGARHRTGPPRRRRSASAS